MELCRYLQCQLPCKGCSSGEDTKAVIRTEGGEGPGGRKEVKLQTNTSTGQMGAESHGSVEEPNQQHVHSSSHHRHSWKSKAGHRRRQMPPMS